VLNPSEPVGFLMTTISPESTINLPRRKLSKGMFPASDYVRFKDEVGFGLTENSWKRWFFWGGRRWGCTLDLRVFIPCSTEDHVS